MFPVTLKLSNTVRNFPKFPVGCSMASRRPPTFPFAYPVFQMGTKGALIATAAPKHCKDTYRTYIRNNYASAQGELTMGRRKPIYEYRKILVLYRRLVR